MCASQGEVAGQLSKLVKLVQRAVGAKLLQQEVKKEKQRRRARRRVGNVLPRRRRLAQRLAQPSGPHRAPSKYMMRPQVLHKTTPASHHRTIAVFGCC